MLRTPVIDARYAEETCQRREDQAHDKHPHGGHDRNSRDLGIYFERAMNAGTPIRLPPVQSERRLNVVGEFDRGLVIGL